MSIGKPGDPRSDQVAAPAEVANPVSQPVAFLIVGGFGG